MLRDTQKDMFCALLGATAAVLLLGRVQDAQIRELNSRPARSL